MFRNPFAKLQSAFQELAEIQKSIDDSARKLVDGITRMIDVEIDDVPSSRAELPGRDFSFYDEVGRMLAAEGFGGVEVRESAAGRSAPPESRALTEFALGDGGTVVAQWFQMPDRNGAPGLRLLSLTSHMENGDEISTLNNTFTNHLPVPPNDHTERLDASVTPAAVLARHRERVAAAGVRARAFADLDAYRQAQEVQRTRTAEFRRAQGLGLIERYVANRFTGERAEVGESYIESIRAHPEWYKYANGAPAAKADPSDTEAAKAWPFAPLTFMVSPTDDGRRTLTTFGMLLQGLPELLLTDVAASHSRASRFVAGTVARAIARRRREAASDADFLAALVSIAGVAITLLPADLSPGDAMFVPLPSGPSGGAAEVRVALRGFTAGDEPSLLGIEPLPGGAGSADERMRELCARLGCAVPVGAPDASFDDALESARRRARAGLAAMKARFQRGLGADERLLVKWRAGEPGRIEYVWVQVGAWRQHELDGEVATPAPRLKLPAGAPVTIAEEQVFDVLLVGAAGMSHAPATDVVAMDYGRDL